MSSTSTLTTVQQAIEQQLQEHFPNVSIVSYDPQPALQVLAPAMLVAIDKIPMGSDLGDDRYPAHCHFSIHCILGWEVPKRGMELWEMACAVARFVHHQGYWLPNNQVTRPENIQIYPGRSQRHSRQGYDSRVVSWSQTAYLGQSCWSASAGSAQHVYLGYAPNGVTPPQEDYQEVMNDITANH